MRKEIKSGSAAVQPGKEWDAAALERLQRVPPFVSGMLVREIEAWVERDRTGRVDLQAVETVISRWRQGGVFHLDPDDPRSH